MYHVESVFTLKKGTTASCTTINMMNAQHNFQLIVIICSLSLGCGHVTVVNSFLNIVFL